MRTTYRIVSTALAVGAAFPFAGVGTAHADTVPVISDVGGWFWSAQTSGTDPTGTVPIGKVVPDQASGVDKAVNMAVAYKPAAPDNQNEPGADPDKETYVSFDVYGVFVDELGLDPEAVTIDKFVVTIPLAKEEDQLNLETAKTSLIACAPDIGFGPAEGEAFAAKPRDDCTKAIPGAFDVGKNAFTFDLTEPAKTWLVGDNFGVGIRNKLDQQQPFQIVFAPYSAATGVLEYTYTPPVEETPEPTVPPAPPIDPGTAPDNSGGGYVPGPALGTPTVAPQPSVVPPTTAPTSRPEVVQRVAKPYERDTSVPAQLWLGLLGAVGLLGVTSLVLGDPTAPATAETSGKVTEALRRRNGGAHANRLVRAPRTA